MKDENFLLDRYIKHRLLLSEKRNGRVIYVKTVTPFITGVGLSHPIEVGFLWHYTLGVPFLPGSSLKGVIRDYIIDLMEDNEKKQIKRIFGSLSKEENQKNLSKEVGSVIFLDMLPTKFPRLKGEIITPHYSQYYLEKEAPGDWMKPIPIPFLAVDVEQEFQIVLLPKRNYTEMDEDLSFINSLLPGILKIHGLGAKTALGYGRFKVI